MTQEEAIRKALDYVQTIGLKIGSIVDVRYLDLNSLDEMAKDCPPDILDTYKSVRKSFRNHWVVAFRIHDVPGQVSCPDDRLVCVFETGEVTLFSSP
jgi:hypothetical protein